MVNFNELRVGNWILESGEPSNVYSLQRGGISFYTINDINVNKQTGTALNGGEDRFSPIPLTPEILEACGFEYDNGYYQDEKGKLFFSTNFNDTMFFAYAGEWNHLSNYYGIGYVDHLHQLQNLYFALTGTELQIDEKIFRKTAEKYS